MKPQLFSGARGQIEFTDKTGAKQILAFVTDVSISTNDNLRPTYTIGDVNPRTIEPLSEDASASIGRIIPINKAEAQPGAAAQPLDKTTAIDHGIEEAIANILSADHVEITIFDKNPSDGSLAVVGSLKFARFAGRSFSSSATDLATERYNFVGLWDGSYGNANTGREVNYGMGNDSQGN